ncbi:magnesium transporter [Aequorivita sp. F47161]|uniref:Magnesium transporter MgtE n=1 Tax=Aequorivita vitellina TaxID=2874475 RepID=A0A9X1U9D8_9FLAO|nr:magnesium transporter [Aequorivita vitellina]MCG2418416.1 magnesium transporter [Aequorivita vitellina]MCZ4318478.1 magnesium transporter [Aequorivita viscosa]
MVNFQNLHPADIAEQLRDLDNNERNLSFLRLSSVRKSEVFRFLEPRVQIKIIKALGNKELSEVLNNLPPDNRTKLFENFPDNLIKTSINLLNNEEREIALSLIGYQKDSTARLMTPHYIQTTADKTVSQVLKHIKKVGKKAETLNFVYVVNDDNKLIDDLRIGELLLAEPATKISELMDRQVLAITTTTPIEEAVEIFDKYDRAALPIITESGVLVGIVTFDDILDRVQELTTKEIHKFGGTKGLDMSYTQSTLLDLVKKRASWLVILFFGEMLTASAMGFFEGQIEKAVVLVLFVPLIISSGGNSGSQAASLIIRAMALKEIKLKDWWYVMKKEILSGLILGTILGSIGFLRIFLWQETELYNYGEFWFEVALSVSVSLVFIVLWGTLSGSLIPFILKWFKLDPATASAPFVATLVDVTGIIIFFSVAAYFLADKLL